MQQSWPGLEVRDVVIQVQGDEGQADLDPRRPQLKVGSDVCVKALIGLGSIRPEYISVQIYHGAVDAWGNIKEGSTAKMTLADDNHHGNGECWFTGSMPCTKTGRYGVAIRILPKHEDLVNPYDLGLILWEEPGARRTAPMAAAGV